MTTHDEFCVACQSRTPHVVTFREVWREDFTRWERLMAVPATAAVLVVIVAVLALLFGGGSNG